MKQQKMPQECLVQQKPSEEEEEEQSPLWKNKPLLRMYHWQTEEVACIEKTYQWLERAGFKDSTRTGLEHKIDRHSGLPYQTGPEVQ